MANLRRRASSRCNPFGGIVGATLILAAAVGFARPAPAAPFPLHIKVIHAHRQGTEIDPQLKELAKQFSKLSFTGYTLKDEARLRLGAGATGSIQLPGGEWMKVKVKEETGDQSLRLELSIDKPKFKSTVTIKIGATLAVSGPPFEGGSLILAVTRPKP